MKGKIQLRGLNEKGLDSGELKYCDSLDEAMPLFLTGNYWKISWELDNGRRIRLVKHTERDIEITYIDEILQEIVNGL